MKQKMYQQFVYKFTSDRIIGDRKKLKSKKPDFKVTLREARLNGEIISLADSNVLRAIDELNGVDRQATAAQIDSIRAEIKNLRESTDNKPTARKRIKELYSELDKIQLKTDYLEVVISKDSDFDKLNQGFSVNGIEYKRLVGTPNGVKKSTVVYCPIVNEIAPLPANLIWCSGRSPALPYPPYEQSKYYYVPICRYYSFVAVDAFSFVH